MRPVTSFLQFLNESSTLSERFTEEENELLSFLMHDKEHVLGSAGHERDPLLDSIFWKVRSHRYQYSLWRGIYEQEKETYENLYQTGKEAVTTRYLSFSESQETAVLFSSQTGILVELLPSKGLLNYHQWIREAAAMELEMNGGDTEDPNYEYLIEAADEELEHIMNIGTRVQVVGKREEGDLTIYTMKQLHSARARS